jgi:hypothetical protein
METFVRGNTDMKEGRKTGYSALFGKAFGKTLTFN